MIQHCVVKNQENKICKGIPDWEREPNAIRDAEGKTKYFAGGTCKLLPETCGKCQSIIESIGKDELDRLSQSKGKIKFEIIPNEKAVTKSKTKKAKMVIEQGRMF